MVVAELGSREAGGAAHLLGPGRGCGRCWEARSILPGLGLGSPLPVSRSAWPREVLAALLGEELGAVGL